MKMKTTAWILIVGLTACSKPTPEIDQRLPEETKDAITEQENKPTEVKQPAGNERGQLLTELAHKLRDPDELPSKRVAIGEQIIREFPSNPHIPSVKAYIENLQAQGDWYYLLQEDEPRSIKVYSAILTGEQPKEGNQAAGTQRSPAMLTIRKKVDPSGTNTRIFLTLAGEEISCSPTDCPIGIQADKEDLILTQGRKGYNDKSVEIPGEFTDRILSSGQLILSHGNPSEAAAFHFKTRGLQQEKLAPK